MTNDTWERVVPVDRLDPAKPFGTHINGTDIAVYLIDGEVYATSGACTHAYIMLEDGAIDGEEVQCPLHGGRFNIKTGEAVALPCTDPLWTYPAKIEDGVVYVKL